MNTIGLRKEEKAFETRVPMVPEDVKTLSNRYGIEFILEPNRQRAFSEEEYKRLLTNQNVSYNFLTLHLTMCVLYYLYF